MATSIKLWLEAKDISAKLGRKPSHWRALAREGKIRSQKFSDGSVTLNYLDALAWNEQGQHKHARQASLHRNDEITDRDRELLASLKKTGKSPDLVKAIDELIAATKSDSATPKASEGEEKEKEIKAEGTGHLDADNPNRKVA
jgi:hypothetical protein